MGYTLEQDWGIIPCPKSLKTTVLMTSTAVNCVWHN